MGARKRTAFTSKSYIEENWLLILFLLAYTLLSLLLFNPRLFTGGDNASYIILAESIVSGKGYRDIHLPDEPQHTKFPFGFPLLLSLPMFLFGSNFIVLKFIVLLTGICSIFFLYKISEMLLGDRVILHIPLYLSLPLLLAYNSRILSEVPFICISLGAIYFFMKTRDDGALFYYLSFVFAAYSFLTRTAGISLVIAMMLFLLIKKQYKYFFAFLIVFGIMVVPWFIRNASIPQEQSYIEQLIAKDPYQPLLGRASIIDYALRVWRNVGFYSTKVIPKITLHAITSEIALVFVGLGLLAVITIGFIRRLRNVTVIELYLVFTLCILLLWPDVWSSDRFLLPIVWVLSLYLIAGMCWLAEKIHLPVLSYILVAVIAILNAYVIGINAKQMLTIRERYIAGDRYAGYRDDWRNYFHVVDAVKMHVPKDKVVMARKPEFVYVVAGNKSFRYPFTEDRERVKQAIRQSDYIIIDRFYQLGISTEYYLMPALLETPEDDYELIYKTDEPVFALIKVKK